VSTTSGNSNIIAPVPGVGTAAKAQPPSRSGFLWRLISSIVLWGIMLSVIFWLPPTALYIFVNVVLARAVWEFYRICEAKGLRTYKVWGVIGTLAAGWVDVEDPVQLLISGTEGHAIVMDNHLYYRSKHIPNSDSKDPFTQLPPAHKPPMLQFLDALGGAPDQPLVKPDEAAARVVVMEAMYRGAREQKWVKLG